MMEEENNLNMMSQYNIKKEDRLKRQRSKNWSEENKELLKELVKKRVKIIENKNTDRNTNQLKKNCWLELEKDFNNLCSKAKRTVSQLKSQWTTIKIQAKTEVSEHRSKLKQTGGGQAPPDVPLCANDLEVWLPNEFIVDYNEFDSDVHCKNLEKNDMSYLEIEVLADAHNQNKTGNSDSYTNEVVKNSIGTDAEEKSDSFDVEQPCSLERKVSKTKKTRVLREKTSIAEDNIIKIAQIDVECRKELNLLQIENEKKKGRNLDLEYELIQSRINYYKRRSSLDM